MGFTKTEQELAGYYELGARRFVDARMLAVMFTTREEIAARLLPPPLEPDDMPRGMMFIAEYPETNLGPGYREAALFIGCKYQGEAGNYCLSMPIDSEEVRLVNGRDIFGFPKKAARIHYEEDGDTVRGWVERGGVRFVEIEANLMAEMPELPESGPNFLFKASPRIDLQPGFDGPVLLCSQKTDVKPKKIRVGSAQVELKPSDMDPWAEVELVDVIVAAHLVTDNTMQPGKVITEVDGEAFLPYYFKMVDFISGKA